MLVPKWWPNKGLTFQPFRYACYPNIHVPQRITGVNFCVPSVIGNLNSVIAIHMVYKASQREKK
jgi:hypothetical protein